MKNLILTIVSVFALSSGVSASNIGDGSLAVLSNDRIEISLENENQKEFILSTSYNEVGENVEFLFGENVNMIQVFNEDGEVQMVLPVGSTELVMGLSLFEEQGTYRMGFMVDGMNDVQFTNVSIR